MIAFKDILTTQLSIRNGYQIAGMSEFVREKGKFTRAALDAYAKNDGTQPAPLVQINKFEDGVLVLLDGHHRGVGILEGGRDYFAKEEMEIKHYTYSDFDDIVFLRPDESWMGWVTPFDPRVSVRLSDIGDFKKRVYDIYWKQSPQHAIHLIHTRPELYKCTRAELPIPVDSIEQLRDTWALESYTLVDSAN